MVLTAMLSGSEFCNAASCMPGAVSGLGHYPSFGGSVWVVLVLDVPMAINSVGVMLKDARASEFEDGALVLCTDSVESVWVCVSVLDVSSFGSMLCVVSNSHRTGCHVECVEPVLWSSTAVDNAAEDYVWCLGIFGYVVTCGTSVVSI